MELSGRNEGKPHRMSLENHKSGTPSRGVDGEGCHAASSNRRLGAVDSGGVSEDDTTGRTIKLNWESSRSGTATSHFFLFSDLKHEAKGPCRNKFLN